MNTLGLNHPAKRNSLWKEAITHHCNIVCAQETHFLASNPPKSTHRNYPHIFTANAHSKTKGVLIAIRDTVAFKIHKAVCDSLGRFLILICDLNSTHYMLVNVYSPNNHQIQFFNRLLKKVKRLQKGLLVICGDFNRTPDLSLDSTSQSKRTSPTLLPSIIQHDLHDAWQCLHATERVFTFFSSPHRIYTRLDLFLVDQQTLLRTSSVTINPIT